MLTIVKKRISALFLAFFMLGISSPGFSDTDEILLDQILAQVGKTVILQSDIRQFKKSFALRKPLDPFLNLTELAQYENLESTPENSPKGRAIETLILDYLVNERIIVDRFTPSEKDTEAEITRMLSSAKTTMAALKEFLSSQDLAFEDYKAMIQYSIAMRSLVEREIRNKVNISDNEIKNYLLSQNQGSKEALKRYEIKLIGVDPGKFKTLEEAKKVIDTAAREIKKGIDFEKVARKYSTEPSAETGGNLGFISADEMLDSVFEQVKKLKVGEVSNIYKDKQKFYILLVSDIKSDQLNQFHHNKEAIRNQLMEKKSVQEIHKWIQEQKEKINVKVESIT